MTETASPAAGKGLTQAEAASRFAADGPNELAQHGRRGMAHIALEVVREPMFLLLVAAGAIYLVLGDLEEALVLLASVFVVMGITIYQERKTERALDALRDLSSPRALVVRDGKPVRIAGREVVRGDLLLLKEGDRVPADAVVVENHDLQCDESLLTGESVSVAKRAGDGADVMQRPGGDGLPFVYSGTLVTRGHGRAVVAATGANTEIGRIGRALAAIDESLTPLQSETRIVVFRIALFGIGLAVLAALLHGLLRGDWLQGLLAGVTLAMAILPEEFPVVLTVFLALGAWRISQQRVLTRRMPAVETLGSATVLCVDKTGTLTQNRMALRQVGVGDTILDIDRVNAESGAALAVIEFAVLASEIEPFDPMERALHEAADTVVPLRRKAAAAWTLLREYPLSNALLAHTHVWQCPGSEDAVVAVKGAPEAVAGLCRLDSSRTGEVESAIATMAAAGLRVLGVARALHPVDELPDAQDGFRFEWLGLVALADPIRPSVPGAIAECRRAGVRVVMITGDYPVTAQSIARQAGIENAGGVVTGADLERMDEAALRERVRSVDVYARVMPEQKLKLVEAFKANGEIVAMTGDGVNDAPALRAAHIGIAMGGRGTDVAREAASLVLLDDDFDSIVGAIRLGRRIYRNIRNAMAYLLAVHVPIAGMAFVPLVFGWPLAFLPIHIVFFEFVIDPACSIVFEADREADDTMRRPPRSPLEHLFDAGSVTLAIAQGAVMLIAVAGVFAWAHTEGKSEEVSRAMAFAAIVIGNLGLILANRSQTRSILATLGTPNPALWWVIAGALSGVMTALYVPPVRELFRFAPLSPAELTLCLGAAVSGLLWFELYKRLRPASRVA